MSLLPPSTVRQLVPAAPLSEAQRLVEAIRQAIVDADRQLDGYMWGAHDYEHLGVLVMENDVDALAAAQRVLLPLQREYAPGLIGAIVKNIRAQGVENAGELVTRESVAAWTAMIKGINEYGRSVGEHDLIDDEKAQEVLLMAFTDPEIAGDVTGLVRERGLFPAEDIRDLVFERRNSVTALREGSL